LSVSVTDGPVPVPPPGIFAKAERKAPQKNNAATGKRATFFTMNAKTYPK